MPMKLILLVAFLAVANAISVIFRDEEKCTFGPSYWCKNAQTGKQCNAVKYCVEHVWLKQFKATSCDECKEGVGFVHSYLADPTTDAEILNLLEAACSEFGSFAAVCKEYVMAYGQEVLELAAQYTANATEVCTKIGFCKSQRVPIFSRHRDDRLLFMPGPVMPQTILKKTENAQSGELCQLCEFEIGYFNKILKKNCTEQVVLKVLDKFCSVLPSSFKAECVTYVNQYVPIIIATLANISPDVICNQLGLCNSTTNSSSILSHRILKKMKKPKAGELCQLCEFGVSYVDKMLKNNATEQEIIQALDTYCNLLPASIKTECSAYVNQYVPIVIETLANLSPELACQQLGLCTSKTKASSGLSHTLLKKMKKPKVHELCAVCKILVGYVDQMLKNNATEQEIIQALDTYCNLLPASIKTECSAYVNQYVPIVIETLANLSPKLACQKLGLCTLKTKVGSGLPQMLLKKPKAGELCAVCEILVSYVDKMLKDNVTEKEIIDSLDSYCNYLPGSLKSDCTAMVNQYVSQIIKLLENLSPYAVCQELGFCTSIVKAAAPQNLNTIGKPQNGKMCVLCELAIKELVKNIGINATVRKIIDETEALCSHLPPAFKSECDTIIVEYGSQIIKLFVNKVLQPAAICQAIRLCSAHKLNMKLLGKSEVKKPHTSMKCNMCELVMKELDSMLMSHATEQDIISALEKVCIDLPSTVQSECNVLVKEYGKDIVDMLIQELSPSLVCQQLGLCKEQKMKGLKEKLKIKKNIFSIKCVVCEYAMKELGTMITASSTEQEIISALDKVCDLIPLSYQTECGSLMKTYGKGILDVLLQEFNPKMVCTVLGLCSQKMRENPKIEKTSFSVECIVCEFVMKELESMVISSSTEQDIINALDKVCSLLPLSYKKECASLVDVYGKAIINLIMAGLSPNIACHELGLCGITSSIQLLNKTTEAVLV